MNIFGKTLILLFIAATLASCNSSQSTPIVSDAAIMETAISTVSTGLAETQRAVPTNTPLPPTATGGIVQTLTGNDGMTLLYVPAGEFTMGSDADDALAECQKFRSDCQRDWFTNEEPSHSVHVDAFWIDQTEVTNKMYALCVEAGGCQKPISTGSETHSRYYGNVEFDNYPVIYVDWSMAKTYCEWVDRRLPTEAEWEKAARGENASVYPWGDTFDESLVNFCAPTCSFDWANKSFNDGFADVAPVGSYPSGKSVYGTLDMAGNVWEWVSSLDKPYPYDATDGRENLDSSDIRWLRGGSWINFVNSVRSANRNGSVATSASDDIGFRCSRSPSGTPTASATPSRTVVPGPTATPIFPPIESFVGIWRNTRGNTGRWPTIVIRASEDGFLFANFREACERPLDWSFPKDCDGGFPSARYSGNPVLFDGSAFYAPAPDNITLSLNGDTLHVTTFTDYANSGIADETHEDEFHKQMPSFPESEQIVLYIFRGRDHRVPLVVVRTVVSTPRLDLHTAFSDEPYTSDTAADLRTALELVLQHEWNEWISSDLETVDVTFRDGHADIVLQGEYSVERDEALSAASVQILLTVFANPSVQSAAVTLNGDTIGNLGVSVSTDAKPADYVYTRAEMETYLKEHAYSLEFGLFFGR